MGTVDFNSPEGKQLLKNLYAFSRGVYNKLYKKEVNERGKGFMDYVHDALDKHLRGADGYDPSKSPLEYHLKFHVIKQTLFNDLPEDVKRENQAKRKSEVDIALHEMSHITPEPKIAQESTVAEIIGLVLSEHDRNLLFTEIEKLIDGDDVVERIYLAVAHERFKISDREEICNECNMSTKDFDNGKRRFVTILTKAFKKLDLI